VGEGKCKAGEAGEGAYKAGVRRVKRMCVQGAVFRQ
jgi:hypothetical protein